MARLRSNRVSPARRILLLFFMLALSWARDARAHEVGRTVMFLELGQSAVSVELRIPPEQLTLAVQTAAGSDLTRDQVMRFVAEHLLARTPDGASFAVAVLSADVEHVGDGDSMVVRAKLTAPSGADARAFELFYDGANHGGVTHDVQVLLRRDLQRGVFDGEAEPLGLLDHRQKSLVVDRANGSFWTGFETMFSLGMRHIAEGTDHVLFLLMLLLPAALGNDGRRWAGPASVRQSLLRTVQIVTAFTVGHSLTLAASAGLGWQLPSRPVESLIAISILLSAAHALRPLFAGREPWVAGGFGFIHGLAFATTLDGIGLDSWTLLQSLLGFNLGIEALQLGVVLVTLPWLILLSRGPHFSFLRVPAAVFGAVTALGWLVERAFGWPSPVDRAVELVADHFAWLLALLAAASLIQLARSRVASVSRASARNPR